MGWKVKFYQTAREESPVNEFIGELEKTTQIKVASYIMLLRNYGPFLKPPYSKKLADKLYELRITGKTSVRIFYTIVAGEYYLLHAFKKKSDKTPKNELKTALDRMRDLI